MALPARNAPSLRDLLLEKCTIKMMKMMHYVHQSPWAPSLQPFFSTFSRTSKHAKTFAHQQMRHSCEQCYCFSEVSARFQLRTCTVIVPKEVDDLITKLSIHTFAPMWCAILFLCLLLKKPNPPKTEDKTQGIIPFWRSFFLQFVSVSCNYRALRVLWIVYKGLYTHS